MKKINMTSSVTVLILATISCFLWGSAFPFIKIGYNLFEISSADTATQILFAGMRFTLAGILTVIITSCFSKKVLKPKKSSWGMILILCAFQTVLQYAFFYIGLANTTGVKASVIEGANVFIAIVVSVLIFRMEKFTAAKVIGCVVGFAGVILVNLSGLAVDYSFNFAGDGAILLSTVAYSFSSVFIKRFSQREEPAVLSGYQFIMGGFIMMIAGIAMGGHIDTWSLNGILVLIYLALVSAIAYTLWSLMLKYNPVSKVAVFGFMTPVFGVILSALFLDEAGQSFGFTEIISLVFVCVGIFVVNRPKRSSKSE